MNRRQVVIVDYSLGNQISVQQLIRQLGHRCCISANESLIANADLAILPGVGAFPAAMKMLREKSLDTVLKERASLGLPILGICLGMQLLTERSEELGLTEGLGLIPGKIKAIETPRWHIGWNNLEINQLHGQLQLFDQQAFFFNHSYAYEGPEQFIMGIANNGKSIPAIIQRDQIIGVQFHPEKSQKAGRMFLSHLIEQLTTRRMDHVA